MTLDPQQLMLFYIANQVASALVQALPAPNGNAWYGFFFKFVSLLTADFKSFSKQLPIPQFQYALSAPEVPYINESVTSVTQTQRDKDTVATTEVSTRQQGTIISSAL